MSKPLPPWVKTHFVEETERRASLLGPPQIKFSPEQMGRPGSAGSAPSPGRGLFVAPDDQASDVEDEDPTAATSPDEESMAPERDALTEIFREAGGDSWEFVRFAANGRKIRVRRWCTDEPLRYWEGLKLTEDFKNVREVSLSRHNLIGAVSGALGRLPYIEVLDLSNNSLAEAIPRELSNLTNLLVLNLSHNNISGSLDLDFTRLSKLKTLDLGWNKLTSFLPEGISCLASCEVFDLSHNGLTGSVPSFLSAISNLKILNLSCNTLGGRIPQELVSLSERSPELEFLDLSGNKLDLPSTFTNEVWQRDPTHPETRPPRRLDSPMIMGPIIGAAHIYRFWGKFFSTPSENSDGDGESSSDTATDADPVQRKKAPPPTLFTTPYVHKVKSPITGLLEKLEVSMRDQGYSPAAINKKVAAEREKLETQQGDLRNMPKKILLPGLIVPQLDGPPPPPFGPRGEPQKVHAFLPPDLEDANSQYAAAAAADQQG